MTEFKLTFRKRPYGLRAGLLTLFVPLAVVTACTESESATGSQPSLPATSQDGTDVDANGPGLTVPDSGSSVQELGLVADSGSGDEAPDLGDGISDGGGTMGETGEGGSGGEAVDAEAVVLDHFSFFVTSQRAMIELSGSADGFGGDFRYGEADGLTGADKICTEIANSSMPGSGTKQWRAFLSTDQVDAIDRVGEGPWYDRLGRLVSESVEGLRNPRPLGAEFSIINDLPNEDGVPNQRPDGNWSDNHHFLTGSDAVGERIPGANCKNWTSAEATSGSPSFGLSWLGPGTRESWIFEGYESGCLPGGTTRQQLDEGPANTVGSGGGYGGIYCFALVP